MDSISQAALGASIGEAVLGQKAGRKGALYGAIIATIPDLDVLLLPFFDAYRSISIHRGYSHSILFSVVMAIVLTALMSRGRTLHQVSNVRLFLFAWLVLFTHMLLDAFTTYGTQLLLPFSNARIGFDSITVVDPVYTLPILLGVLLAITRFHKMQTPRRIANYAGLALSTAYLLFTLGNKTVVERSFESSFTDQHIEFNHLYTVPVSAANIKWFGLAFGPDSLYMNTLVRGRGPTDDVTTIPIHEHLLDNIDPDIAAKMKWFAKQHYAVAGTPDSIRFYNLQVDMQGIHEVGEDLAPTAWYYLIVPRDDGSYFIDSRVHDKQLRIGK